MKIRIITHHSVHNHGAVLQLYALTNVLSKYDNTVCALDYTKNLDFLDVDVNKYNISIKSVPFYLSYLIKKGISRTLFNVNKREILEHFKKKNKLVGEYYSHCKNLDAVFVGSDEVFSIEPGLNTFFWGFGVPAEFMFSYAGCFGPTTINTIKEKKALEYVEAGIKRFNKISVRDYNSQKIVKELSGYTPKQVCDPVILYDFKNEKNNFRRPIKDKYILIYAYDENMNDEKEYKHICEFAKLNNFKVLTVGFYHKWCDKSINADPLELLCWINYAEYVVTDTFHGTVMSLVMNTPFATKIRGNRNKLGFLLEEYDCLDREINEFSEIKQVLRQNIDFIKINSIIDSKRINALQYIDSCINLVKNK